MESNDVPEARSLDTVRQVVVAVGRSHSDPAKIGAAVGLDKRHVRYHLQAARILGLVEFVADAWHVTPTGRRLLETTPQSPPEAALFERSLKSSEVFRSVPTLLDEPAPSLDAIVDALKAHANLSSSTARKRARVLLAWHARLRRPFDYTSKGKRSARLRRNSTTNIDDRTLYLFPDLETNTTGRAKDDISPAAQDDAAGSHGDEVDAAPEDDGNEEESRALRTSPPGPLDKPTPRPVLTYLKLERFKNFREVVFHIGAFTVLVGANASGKSNVRDAFRFLHGIARGYTLAEIIGEKWIEGGVLQWRGIRGGSREVTFAKSPTFVIEVGFKIPEGSGERDATYRIEVEVDANGKPPRVVAERLVVSGRGQFVFDSHPEKNSPQQKDPLHLTVRLRKQQQRGFVGPTVDVISNRPALSQLLEMPDVKRRDIREHIRQALAAFRSMRFLDLSPEAMRIPSLPGQTILGDRGENLSSVLLALCADPRGRHALVGWVEELTPMDVKDFEFPADAAGKVLLTLVEENGVKTSGYSASDGTLRFLAMIAALLGPEPADLYFFEELENGIHPTRLYLLLELIEKQAAARACQVVATTHSPQLLAFLSSTALETAALVYRLKGETEGHIKRVLDIPGARRLLEKRDLATLLGSGWLENAVALTADQESE